MGVVALCHDERIGREVALKVLRRKKSTDDERRGRFVREARIQARLQHPTLVPVYETSEAEAEEPWFIMRHVRGETLRDILDRLASGDETVRFRRNKLLQILERVCRALAYAHERGVVHRDVTPWNVMIGAFGEVHLIDWGIAKLIGDPVDGRPTSSDVPDDELETTATGSTLGTPGYMSPEQALGDQEIGPASDVYSLGCILFEILTLERANSASGTSQRMARTIKGIDARPSVRVPGVTFPPELEELCVRATHVDPEQRMQSATILADGIEAFLEGDRDHALRRRLAGAAAVKGRELLERSDEDRPAALRELARAVALDPENTLAATDLARLLVEPPKMLPEGARESLSEWLERARRRAAKVSAARFGLWLFFLPAYAVMGIRVGWIFALISTLLVLAFGLSVLHASGRIRGPGASTVIYLTTTVGLLLFASAFSPLIFIPPLLATNLMYFCAHVTPRVRGLFIVLTALGVGFLFTGEALGLWPPTFEITEAGILIIPRALDFPPGPTWAVLAAWGVLSASIPGLQAGRSRDKLVKTEQRLLRYVWQARQLVPQSVGTAPSFDEDSLG